MRSFFAALLLLLLPACSLIGLGDDDKKLEIVEAGIFKNGSLVMNTTGVPEELGLTFGIRFRYVAPKSGPIKATITTSTPGLINPVKDAVEMDDVTQATLEPGKTYESLFSFYKPCEMASGHWTFKVETEKGDTVSMILDVYNMDNR
jgi:hypothetical protein